MSSLFKKDLYDYTVRDIEGEVCPTTGLPILYEIDVCIKQTGTLCEDDQALVTLMKSAAELAQKNVDPRIRFKLTTAPRVFLPQSYHVKNELFRSLNCTDCRTDFN